MGNQRGLVQRIERMLEDGVGDVFARVFGGSIVPQELEALLRREASDGVQRLAGDRFLVPNEYVITLSASDFAKLSADRELTAQSFARHLAGYIEEQGWQTYGEVVVRLDQSEGLHTGQYRARAVVNPDADPRPSASAPAAAELNNAYRAEPGVSAMTDNPSYRGEPGQGRPGDEYYDDQYGRPQEEQRAPYPQDQGYRQGPPPGYPQQGGYPDQGYSQGYAPGPYEQRPPAPGYGPQGGGQGYEQGYDQGYRQGPPPAYPQQNYGPPPNAGYAPPAGDYDYGRPRYDDPGYGRHEPPRPAYPDQGYQQPGYQQPGYGGGSYGQPEYAQPDYGRYDQGYAAPAQPAAPAGGDYDYGQPAAGYGGYAPAPGQSEYASATRTVTLQLDDGSGRTYQLREGANVIGRGQDAQFRLPDTGVSRRHLEIRWDGQAALLSDLNSTNGTTVNNAPVQEWQLADGDVIRVGHSEIIVHVR